jgi:hypothetical protein
LSPSPGSEVRGFAFALLLCCANAFADGPPPSANEAHDFIADTFQRYSIGYVVWYGGKIGDNSRGHAGAYSGRDCYSEVSDERSGRVFAVDWSTISSVQPSGADGIYVMGQLVRPAQYGFGRRYSNFHVYSPDAKVSRSLLNAFQLLYGICQKRSRFD